MTINTNTATDHHAPVTNKAVRLMMMSPPPRRRRRKPLGTLRKNNDNIVPSPHAHGDGKDIIKVKKLIKNASLSSPSPSPSRPPPPTTTYTNTYAVPSTKTTTTTPTTTPEEKFLILTTPMKTPVTLNYNRNNNTATPRPTTTLRSKCTPNAGKLLSPLPLQPRRLYDKTKQQVVTIDNMNHLQLLKQQQQQQQQNPNKEDDNDSTSSSNMSSIKGRKYEMEDQNVVKDEHRRLFAATLIMITTANDSIGDDDANDSIGSSEWEPIFIDDFEFVRKLGTGGTADVYQVVEKDTQLMFALKVQKATTDAACEMDLLTPLNHPHICKMIDYFYCTTKPFAAEDENKQQHDDDESKDDNDNTKYVCTILELCMGGSLHDVIDRFAGVRMPESVVAQYMKDAIDALEYLHTDEMIIHCDIKPANWLVSGTGPIGTIKLADFGMAVPFNEREIVGGSPVYMAPEHLLAWRDMTDKFDYRTDIYSLGVVLYEMLLGYLPYEVLEATATTTTTTTTNEGIENTGDEANTDDPSEPKSESHANGNGNDDGIESIGKELLELSIAGDGEEDGDNNSGRYPVLDLRKLNDVTSNEPFYIPPPIFVDDVSEEAQDLILRLMEPSVYKRITLQEAKNHEWFQKVLPVSSNDK